MFDHSNPTAFHHVFYFLFKELNQERTKAEFRDCWPILDKKQEAEFRRKVVNLLKEYQKEFPADLPYTNPSLFQSPGGRKFTAFLAVFSSFVIKTMISKSDESILSKPVTKVTKLRNVCFSNLGNLGKLALQDAVECQEDVERIVESSKKSMESISEKYFILKNMENDDDVTALEELKLFHADFVERGIINKDKILEHYDKKCDKVKELQNNLKALFDDHKDNWNNIISVADDSVPAKKLNLSLYAKELVAEDDLSLTFQNMITKSLYVTGRVLEYGLPTLPAHDVAQSSCNLGSQLHLLTELQEELGNVVEKMQKHVQEMLRISVQIDWANCELAHPATRSSKENKVLLPPTPSMLGDLRAGTGGRKLDLQLLSPDTPAQSQVAKDTPAIAKAPETPVSTGQVSRRIHRRITPDPSPLLKQSLTNSMISRNKKDESSYRAQDSTKDSLGVFSPVLSSTKSPNSSSSSETDSVTEDADITCSQAHNETQNKIDMYKKVLQSVGRPEKTEYTNKSSLLSAWSRHKESLSPRIATPPRKFSPLLNCDTPDKSYQEMDSKLVTRLDQLMTSLTLSDNSINLSLGNMDLEEDIDLLSPHCPSPHGS